MSAGPQHSPAGRFVYIGRKSKFAAEVSPAGRQSSCPTGGRPSERDAAPVASASAPEVGPRASADALAGPETIGQTQTGGSDMQMVKQARARRHNNWLAGGEFAHEC